MRQRFAAGNSDEAITRSQRCAAPAKRSDPPLDGPSRERRIPKKPPRRNESSDQTIEPSSAPPQPTTTVRSKPDAINRPAADVGDMRAGSDVFSMLLEHKSATDLVAMRGGAPLRTAAREPTAERAAPSKRSPPVSPERRRSSGEADRRRLDCHRSPPYRGGGKLERPQDYSRRDRDFVYGESRDGASRDGESRDRGLRDRRSPDRARPAPRLEADERRPTHQRQQHPYPQQQQHHSGEAGARELPPNRSANGTPNHAGGRPADRSPELARHTAHRVAEKPSLGFSDRAERGSRDNIRPKLTRDVAAPSQPARTTSGLDPQCNLNLRDGHVDQARNIAEQAPATMNGLLGREKDHASRILRTTGLETGAVGLSIPPADAGAPTGTEVITDKAALWAKWAAISSSSASGDGEDPQRATGSGVDPFKPKSANAAPAPSTMQPPRQSEIAQNMPSARPFEGPSHVLARSPVSHPQFPSQRLAEPDVAPTGAAQYSASPRPQPLSLASPVGTSPHSHRGAECSGLQANGQLTVANGSPDEPLAHDPLKALLEGGFEDQVIVGGRTALALRDGWKVDERVQTSQLHPAAAQAAVQILPPPVYSPMQPPPPPGPTPPTTLPPAFESSLVPPECPVATILWVDESAPEDALASKLSAIVASGWRVLFYPNAYETLRHCDQWAQIGEPLVHMRCLLVATPQLCDLDHVLTTALPCTRTDCSAEHTAHPIVPPHERLRLPKSALCLMFQEESSLVLLGKLASQYSELVMFTHLAGKIISPQMSQRLRVLATRANIAHEHLDVQCPTQIIDVIQAAFAATCTPPSPAKEAAVRSLLSLLSSFGARV